MGTTLYDLELELVMDMEPELVVGMKPVLVSDVVMVPGLVTGLMLELVTALGLEARVVLLPHFGRLEMALPRELEVDGRVVIDGVTVIPAPIPLALDTEFDNEPELVMNVVNNGGVALLQLERLETAVARELEPGETATDEVVLAVPAVLARLPETGLAAVVMNGVSVSEPRLLFPLHSLAVAVVLLVVVALSAASDLVAFVTREPMYTVSVTVLFTVTVTVPSNLVLLVTGET
jgi:hypothetical protein